jgi:DNA invertase Pin-like site-specific DNA recombinase
MKAARARGARLGARGKLDAEKITRIEEMIRSGSPLNKAAKALGVTPATIYNNIPRERIADLREEADKLKEGGAPSDEARH